ncbi:hypothetical protein KBB68_03365 [Candidatus Babeliales bacterium]|nr:hypothetical protein [Candidatus Babeliales bacterium]
MKIHFRAQRFVSAIFLLLSFQVAYNVSITRTRTRRSSSSDDSFSSRSSDDNSSSRRSSESSSKSNCKESQESKTVAVDSCTVTKEEIVTQQKTACSSSVNLKKQDDEEYEKRREDDYDRRQQEERKRKEDDETFARYWEEHDAAARHVEKIRLEKVEFERAQQAKTVNIDTSALAQEKIKFALIESVPLKQNPSKLTDVQLNVQDELNDMSEQESSESVDETIKVFIPTREFYENNREYFATTKDIAKYPIFIPESFKTNKVSLLAVYNHYFHGEKSTGFYFSPDSNFNNFSPDPRDPKNKKSLQQDQIMTIIATVAGQMLGVARYAVVAGEAGVTMTFAGPLIPVLVGTVIVGYVTTVIIPGLKDPVPVVIDPDIKNMTQEQREEYLKAKKLLDDFEKQQNNLKVAKIANDGAFKNGICTGWSDEKIIDLAPVDPILMYKHGSLQRALDIAISIPISITKSNPLTVAKLVNPIEKIVFFDGKIIKFKQESGKFGLTNSYKATLVEDIGQLTKQDEKILRETWGCKAKKNLNEQKKQQQNNASKTSSGGPGQDPNDPNENKDKKKQPNGEYESNPKHHQNTQKNIGKEPPRPIEALGNSLYVDEKTRVAIQDEKIVIFRKHGTTVDGIPKYHSYIENDIHRVQEAKKVLEKLGLINPKSGKVLKK